MLYDGHDTYVRIVHFRLNGYRAASYCGEYGTMVYHYTWRRVGEDKELIPLPCRICGVCFAMAQRAGMISKSEVMD